MIGERQNNSNICGLCCCFIIFVWILTSLGYLPSASDFVNLQVKTQLINEQLRRQIQELKIQVKVLDRQINYLQSQIGASQGVFQRQKEIQRARQFVKKQNQGRQFQHIEQN